jgi:hypothetical protein
MRGCIIVAFLALAGCATEPLNNEAWMERERNACLPTAIAMAEGLKRQGVQARVVRFRSMRKGKSIGHAITAYLYPPGDNKLWTYDYLGSWRTKAFWNDALGIAIESEELRGTGGSVTFAEFLQ